MKISMRLTSRVFAVSLLLFAGLAEAANVTGTVNQ